MKTILLFLLLCISLSTSAQTVDERAGIYMNQTDWGLGRCAEAYAEK